MSKNIPFFCLPNLSESRLCRRDPAAYPHPGYTTRDKRRFRAWCADNSTDHLFFNLTEGLNPHLRVSKQNPPQFLHGIVADYGSQTHVQMGYDAYGPARTVTITVEQIETDGDGDDAVIDRRKVEIAVPAGTEG